MRLTRRHQLTVYDAAYLALALRAGLPLATLDATLAATSPRACAWSARMRTEIERTCRAGGTHRNPPALPRSSGLLLPFACANLFVSNLVAPRLERSCHIAVLYEPTPSLRELLLGEEFVPIAVFDHHGLHCKIETASLIQMCVTV